MIIVYTYTSTGQIYYVCTCTCMYSATLLSLLYTTVHESTLTVWQFAFVSDCRDYFVSLFYRNETNGSTFLPLSVEACANHTRCTLDEFTQ